MRTLVFLGEYFDPKNKCYFPPLFCDSEIVWLAYGAEGATRKKVIWNRKEGTALMIKEQHLMLWETVKAASMAQNIRTQLQIFVSMKSHVRSMQASPQTPCNPK